MFNTRKTDQVKMNTLVIIMYHQKYETTFRKSKSNSGIINDNVTHIIILAERSRLHPVVF